MLEARGITKCFGGSALLKDLGLCIKPGEVVGLSGGNGSGKSTLIDILMGRTRPDAGEVRVDGRIAVTSKRAHRPKAFRTYQVPRLFFEMTIAENLGLGQWAFGPNGGGSDVVNGLPDHENTARILSVGQRRRIVLEWLKARIGHCQYFLLDEPTAGADSEYMKEMEQFIKANKSNGIGFLVVEHKPEFLQRVSDRKLSLQNGALIPNEFEGHTSFLADGISPRSHNEQAILRAEGLSVRRGGAKVVNNVSLTVSRGETLVVTGRNGCGKSSLLLTLYGHRECELDAGNIVLEGEDVSSLPHTARMQRGIHLLPQEAATFDSLLVEEILQLTANTATCSIRDSEMRTLCEMMPHLTTILRRRCGVLSGGERRMVGMARLILLKPKVALLDEPLAGLSPDGRGLISSAISRLASTGTAVVLAEQEDLLKYVPSDRVLSLTGNRPKQP